LVFQKKDCFQQYTVICLLICGGLGFLKGYQQDCCYQFLFGAGCLDWLVFAFLSPAFWGLNNVFNKFLVAKKFRGYFSIVSYLHFIDLIFAGIIHFVVPVSFSFPYAVFAMAVGLFPLAAFWFYTEALRVEEVSRVLLCSSLFPYSLFSCLPCLWMRF
jgi:uncharacterized membrane protein